MDAIRLRDATSDDVAAIGALHVASWRETYAGILPDAMLAALSAEAWAAMWQEVLRNPDAFGGTALVVAEDEAGIFGFGSCGRQRDPALADAGYDGEIGALYILRARQHRGTGRAIMAALARALSGRGYAGASLWVLRENDPARSFYQALGGEIIGERSETHAGETHVELAYGWRDVCRLLR